MEEWFDVVSRSDVPLASAPRGYVHAHGLRHRSVHLVVFDADGKRVYLQLRAPTKDTHPNVWDTSCCGHVDRGETYEEALWRELREELSLEQGDLERFRFCFKIDASPTTGMEFVHVYRARTLREPRPDPGEIAEGRWVEKECLSRWVDSQPQDFAPSFRYLWPKAVRS